MPLQIELKPHEKIFLNGAVIANGSSRSTFTVLNEVSILREKDILTEQTADTPCKRVYLSIQLMYMDPANASRYHHGYRELSDEVMAAAPSTAALLSEIDSELSHGRLYKSLKVAKALIDYEQELINHAR